MLTRIVCLGFLVLGSVGCGELASKKGVTTKDANPEQTENPNGEKESPRKSNGGLNIAVAPGGGLNAYTSVFLTEEFAKAAGAKVKDIFDLYWGLSGGTLAATMFMSGAGEKVPENFKANVKKAFPDIDTLGTQIMGQLPAFFLNPKLLVSFLNDEDSARRKKFETALVAQIGDKKFNKNAGNRFVLVASAKNEPMCYADSAIQLPPACMHKSSDGARVVDGIINSSNYQISKSLLLAKYPAAQGFEDKIPIDRAPTFKQHMVKVKNGDFPVVDAFPDAQNYLDGASPLPLVIDYLKQIKTSNNAEHNIVVFDNGVGSIPEYSNQDFRNNIRMNAQGVARIEKNGVVINVFLLTMKVPRAQFDAWTIDQEDSHWADAEALVKQEIKGPRKGVFEDAITAVKKNIVH